MRGIQRSIKPQEPFHQDTNSYEETEYPSSWSKESLNNLLESDYRPTQNRESTDAQLFSSREGIREQELRRPYNSMNIARGEKLVFPASGPLRREEGQISPSLHVTNSNSSYGCESNESTEKSSPGLFEADHTLHQVGAQNNTIDNISSKKTLRRQLKIEVGYE